MRRAPPRTERAIGSPKTSTKSSKGGKRRKRGLSPYDVAQIIQRRKIDSRVDFMALAASQNPEGKSDLAEFICNRGSKVVDECLAIAKELGCTEKFARSQKTRIQLLEEAYASECAHGCNGQYLEAAIGLLERNEIPVSAFAKAIFSDLQVQKKLRSSS